ncbi:MAG: TonB-dependent receptor plug domain-containing protein, partial [Candidatus Dormibacteraceae bacterium]
IPLVREKLALTIGSKLEHNNYTGFEVQPSARLLWRRTPGQAFWVSISRAVRTPSRLDEDIQLTDFASVAPPIDFRVIGDGQFFSEELIGYEAGYRTQVTPHVYLDLALFHNDYNYLESFQMASPFLETSPQPVHAILPLLIRNGTKGTTNGFEVAPDWKPTSWWELKASYSYLNMDLERRPGSNDPITVLTDEESSPRNQVTVQSFLDLPKRFEFDQTYRFVSALPAQRVGSYGTADARFGWRPTRYLELSVAGQNLLQPYHAEFGGDTGPLVEIKRSAYGKITFRW